MFLDNLILRQVALIKDDKSNQKHELDNSREHRISLWTNVHDELWNQVHEEWVVFMR